MSLMRVPTVLPDELEDLIHRTIGTCIAVHTELGPGLLESLYARAVAAELSAAGIPFEIEKVLPVYYRGDVIGHHRLDILVAGQLVLEIKAVERLLPIHVAQMISYLNVSQAKVGLLLNFNAVVLKQGLRRVVL
jgi:GxxExxY protein